MPKKILIVEDSRDIGNALKLLIELEGYEVAVAPTGAEGLDKSAAGRPDLIVIDYRLPDLSGAELIRRLRAQPANGGTPILCVSSYLIGYEAEVISAGCHEVLSKTTFIQNFRETLKKYLGE